MRSKKILTLATGLLISGVILGMQIESAMSSDDTYESMRKLEEAFKIISKRYVDDVDTASLAEEGIQGMLKDLDPHSIYIDAERMQDVNEDFNASFDGIGISYEFIPGEDDQDTLAVLNPLPGGPSEKAGLWSGDRIIGVDDSSAIGYTRRDVERSLKGPRGTKVKVHVRRPGYDEDLSFTITRGKIPIHTVDASYMIDSKTGYVKLQRFARTTYKEFMTASRDLKDQGMERMVLDLRNNAGGFMDMAIRISDEFVSGEKLIVSAKSRIPDFNSENRAHVKGLLEDMPVIVLVNEQSASASEIVAGALQDHDRALIVGRRTFGKGLVQKQFPFQDGSVLRMTISRYYTPSGRFIQTPYESGDREDYYNSKVALHESEEALDAAEIVDQIPDSLKYETDNGRIVVGGGGILPDYIISRDSISPFVQAVLGKRHDRVFARDWVATHSESFHEGVEDQDAWLELRDDFVTNFDIGEDTFAEFESFLVSNKIFIVGEDEVPTEIAEDERYFVRSEVEKEKEWMKNLLKAHIAVRMFDQAAWYPIRHEYDRTLNEALNLWRSAEDLLALNH
ncbi:MAG: S41 family peptidase [Rhodothermaceae bacterium]|nr:S41 family peptidase [Rhodothermaceae bacterium]